MTARWMSKFFGTTFATAPHNNGITRFVQQLQRITIKFCKTGGSSRGVREFIERDLIHFARANPGVVVYLKPRRHRSPMIEAEYLNGNCEHLTLHNKIREDIVRWIDVYQNRSGEPTKKLIKDWHTDQVSIQGTWTPWTHQHPETFQQDFPSEEACAAPKLEKTAHDELREIAERAYSS